MLRTQSRPATSRAHLERSTNRRAGCCASCGDRSDTAIASCPTVYVGREARCGFSAPKAGAKPSGHWPEAHANRTQPLAARAASRAHFSPGRIPAAARRAGAPNAHGEQAEGRRRNELVVQRKLCSSVAAIPLMKMPFFNRGRFPHQFSVSPLKAPEPMHTYAIPMTA